MLLLNSTCQISVPFSTPTPVLNSYAATIGIMALFTVVLEFDGGTYISQVSATSAHNAAMKHAAHLIGIKEMGTLVNRRRLANRLSVEQPVSIEGARNVWCCSASVGEEVRTGEHRGNRLMRGF